VQIIWFLTSFHCVLVLGFLEKSRFGWEMFLLERILSLPFSFPRMHGPGFKPFTLIIFSYGSMSNPLSGYSNKWISGIYTSASCCSFPLPGGIHLCILPVPQLIFAVIGLWSRYWGPVFILCHGCFFTHYPYVLPVRVSKVIAFADISCNSQYHLCELYHWFNKSFGLYMLLICTHHLQIPPGITRVLFLFTCQLTVTVFFLCSASHTELVICILVVYLNNNS